MKLLPQIKISLPIIQIVTRQYLATSKIIPSPSSFQHEKEIIIPVELYDSFFQKLNATSSKSHPPRYYVGTLGIPPFFRNLFTFDLGNPRQTMLDVNTCRGCNVYDENNTSIGCPDTVPACDNEDNTVCWVSDPEEPLPFWSYVYTYESCDTINATSAGYLPKHTSDDLVRKDNPMTKEVPVCMACFDAGNHSRFFALATTSYSFHLKFLHPSSHEVVGSLPHDYVFGALVRTVPQFDRIWSNIGLGYNSSFLQQMNVSTFMFDNSPTINKNVYNQRSVILHPTQKRYDHSPYVHFDTARHRQFHLHSIQCGDLTNAVIVSTDTIFMMDTGNDGISIADMDLKYQLEYSTRGVWLPDDVFDPSNYGSERLFIYSSIIQNNTFLKINFQVMMNDNFNSNATIFSIPVSNWILQPSFVNKIHKDDSGNILLPTIFVTYDKNVLGLPFLSSPFVNYVFDDDAKKLFFLQNQMMDNIDIM